LRLSGCAHSLAHFGKQVPSLRGIQLRPTLQQNTNLLI
jgi:hypothetical protein